MQTDLFADNPNKDFTLPLAPGVHHITISANYGSGLISNAGMAGVGCFLVS